MEHGHILCSFARYYKPYPGVFVASLVFDTSDTPLKTNSNSPWKQAFLTQNTPKRKDLSSKPSVFSGKVLVSGRIQELWSEWWQRCHFCHPTIISSGEANHKPPLQKHTSIASRTTFKPFEKLSVNKVVNLCKLAWAILKHQKIHLEVPAVATLISINLRGP